MTRQLPSSSTPRPRRAPGARAAWTLCVALLGAGCGSAGPYGYAKTYSPLDAEDEAAESAKDYDPVMASRSPQAWKGVDVSVFGVVSARNQGPGGKTDVTLSVRTLEPRNLCDSSDESTCRVTVSDREHAVVHALLKLRPDDTIGEKSVGVGSLVRVIGPIADEVSTTDGQKIIDASYYRHWPRNHFVTTAARSYMKR
jgi:hypothetical protein